MTSMQAVPTYAELLTSSAVLNPVIELHPGLTLEQLRAMIIVKPQSNTQLIELDVENGDPHLATNLANEISQSLAQFSNSKLPATVLIQPVKVPVAPVRPNVSVDTGIGALLGLVLALALMLIFGGPNPPHPRDEPYQFSE